MLNQNIIAKLQIFINKCLRRILKIFWPNLISNVNLLARCNMKEVRHMIKERKWRWLGHTLRKDPTDITRQALRWNPQGKRKRGRPKNTWRRELEKELKEMDLTWSEAAAKAKDRTSWRSLVCSLCPT